MTYQYLRSEIVTHPHWLGLSSKRPNNLSQRIYNRLEFSQNKYSPPLNEDNLRNPTKANPRF